MTTKRTDMSVFKPAKKRVEVSVGETLRILRELQEVSQGQLAEMTGIPQPTISAIENDRINLGVDRANFCDGSSMSPSSSCVSRMGKSIPETDV